MTQLTRIYTDVAVIGAGPAGIAAALKAREAGASVTVIERNSQPGGILRQCIHSGFGLKYFDEELTGPEYAQRFINKLQATSVALRLNSMVLRITPAKEVVFMCEQGMVSLQAKAVVLAMGCRERTRGEIKIPGARIAGVFTAGLAQRYINQDNLKPGSRFVILGSGDIGLIMARRLALEGMDVAGVYELMPYANGLYRNIKNCLDDFGIPLHLSTTVTRIVGHKRVEAVEVSKVDERLAPIPGTKETVPCDTLLLSIGLIPENELSRGAGVELNPATNGALVDDNLCTSIPGIFACGNVLHVHDLVDNVTAEAELAGRSAALFATGALPLAGRAISVAAFSPIGYTVPSTLVTGQKAQIFFRVRKPLDNHHLEVHSGTELIFKTKPRDFKPSIMEHLNLPPALLARCGAKITLSVVEN